MTTFQYQTIAIPWEFASLNTTMNDQGALGWRAVWLEWDRGQIGQVWVTFEMSVEPPVTTVTAIQKSGPPVAGDLVAGTAAVFKDTSQGAGLGVVLAYNDGGTLVTVAMA